MKGNQRIALVLTLFVIAVAAVTSQAETSLYEARKRERLYSIRYPGWGGKENAEEVLYSDSYFSQPSTATNAKLAHASMALSAAAYSEPLIQQAVDIVRGRYLDDVDFHPDTNHLIMPVLNCLIAVDHTMLPES